MVVWLPFTYITLHLYNITIYFAHRSLALLPINKYVKIQEQGRILMLPNSQSFGERDPGRQFQLMID